MKASELVKKLQDTIKQFGDLEVTNESDSIITGVSTELVIIGEATSHFCLDESFIDVNEFKHCVDFHMANGMSEEEARKAAFGDLED